VTGGNGLSCQEVKMFEWRENHKGNFIYVKDGVITTVFKSSDGDWYGISDSCITEKGFETPEDAMEAIDNEEVDFNEFADARDTGWLAAKKGGLYRQNSEGIATVKQAKSSKWYVTINGNIVEGKWLNSKEEAMNLADNLLC